MSDHDVPPGIRAEALRRLAAGDRILAIKVVHDTGLSLKDAKDYVDGLRWEVVARNIPPDVEARAAELVAKGKTTKAIREVRKGIGADFRVAKAYVEALAEGRRLPTLADRARALLAQNDRTGALVTVQAETGMTEEEADRFLASLGDS